MYPDIRQNDENEQNHGEAGLDTDEAMPTDENNQEKN